MKRCVEAWNRIKSLDEHKGPLLPSYVRVSDGIGEITTVKLGFSLKPTKERLHRALTAGGCCELSGEHGPPHPSDSTGDLTSTMQTVMQEVMRERSLWMKRSGRFALGSYLRGGDRICLAYGCSNPIALRGEENDTVRVLGTCF